MSVFKKIVLTSGVGFFTVVFSYLIAFSTEFPPFSITSHRLFYAVSYFMITALAAAGGYWLLHRLTRGIRTSFKAVSQVRRKFLAKRQGVSLATWGIWHLAFLDEGFLAHFRLANKVQQSSRRMELTYLLPCSPECKARMEEEGGTAVPIVTQGNKRELSDFAKLLAERFGPWRAGDVFGCGVSGFYLNKALPNFLLTELYNPEAIPALSAFLRANFSGAAEAEGAARETSLKEMAKLRRRAEYRRKTRSKSYYLSFIVIYLGLMIYGGMRLAALAAAPQAVAFYLGFFPWLGVPLAGVAALLPYGLLYLFLGELEKILFRRHTEDQPPQNTSHQA